ncbi:lipoyl(octanoyl) transferase LipB [Komagataeibacter swingsii]|uniref:Octanoyltransferase n=1 Tax=Komagataeibacter swingsii TaxID=215220 RepID=A0A850P0W1_9PROT|nr:lipoyl(octanoyl) transferase LipB [Komagataeibacter swingsii]NVN36076.1 lipoyl(octanoyl) transferase LipB [Komagataeibacter swingsii]RFP05500.1 lipoate-protein ligase B [Komagataeibacter xylinus]RFP06333.1 lipoate-protein ligase B [Komagataeibacter xylinus]
MEGARAMTENEFLWNRAPNPVPYPTALAEMEAQARGIRAGTLPERVWLLEHPPTYTAGTSARDSDLFNPRGYPTYPAGRGGQWTYHGPGQRVAYAMLDLTRPHGMAPPRDLRAYVHTLEEWIIRTLRRFGVEGERRADRIGVWVVDPATGREEKVAAIGVRVSRWVSWHGIAINVAPDLSDFGGIVPCGISEYGVTSLKKLGRDVSMDEIDAALAATWPECFGPIPGVRA